VGHIAPMFHVKHILYIWAPIGYNVPRGTPTYHMVPRGTYIVYVIYKHPRRVGCVTKIR
jgi:hypothetical protein